MHRIRSNGGPLICINPELASSWHGIDESVTGFANDYERACDIDKYFDTLEVAGESAIILGDMPLSTEVFKDALSSILIVRYLYCEPHYSASLIATSHNEDIFESPEETKDIQIKSKNIIIFDSAYSGKSFEESIKFSIIPGHYRVLTQLHKPDFKTSLLLHKFYNLS